MVTSWLGHNFFYFEELASTNSYAKKMDRVDTLHGAIVLADNQLLGRGQYERNWEATPNQNLTFSIVFEPQNADRLTILTLACAKAIADVCTEQIEGSAELKWPNDVLVDEKKLAGLLTEAVFNGSVLERVIVGIGININQLDFGSELNHKATSLAILNGKKYSRERVLAHILTRIEFYYRLWVKQDIELVKQINRTLIGFGSWTRLNVNGLDKEGEYKFLGINEKGSLIVLNKELEVDTFSYEQVRISLA